MAQNRRARKSFVLKKSRKLTKQPERNETRLEKIANERIRARTRRIIRRLATTARDSIFGQYPSTYFTIANEFTSPYSHADSRRRVRFHIYRYFLTHRGNEPVVKWCRVPIDMTVVIKLSILSRRMFFFSIDVDRLAATTAVFSLHGHH